MEEQDVNKWITKWVAQNCRNPQEALYGLCVEFADELYSFLTKNGEKAEIWELWSLDDEILSKELSEEVSPEELKNKIKQLKLVYPSSDLCDIGFGCHHVIKWNGSFWDGKGKRNSTQDVINDFNLDNKNLHFFRTV